MLKKRRMLLSLGAAATRDRSARAHRRSASGPRAGPSADLLLVGRRAQRAGEDHDARPVRQAEEDRDRLCVADQLRQDQGDGRGRRAGMGSRRCRRPLHRPGQGPARDARHEPHPEREESRSGLGHEPRHLHVDRRDGDGVEHEGVPGGQGSGVVEGLLGRQGIPGSARPLQAALLQLRGRAARGRRPVQPDLSGHRRQDQDRLRQAARDQAAREGLVDRRRAAAAAPVERRARALLRRGPAASSR